MKNIGVFKNAGNQGYILMPRRLLNLLFAEHDDLDLFKLYAYLLLKATFRTAVEYLGYKSSLPDLNYEQRNLFEAN